MVDTFIFFSGSSFLDWLFQKTPGLHPLTRFTNLGLGFAKLKTPMASKSLGKSEGVRIVSPPSCKSKLKKYQARFYITNIAGKLV